MFALATLLAVGLIQVVAVARPAPAHAAAGDIGIRDASFAAFNGTTIPTAPKPESKLWWAGGSWWASMASTATNGYGIFRLDRSTETWVDTGVALDARGNSQADTLWNGTHLFVASHVVSSSSATAASGNPAYLYRFSLSGGKWSMDSGFPVTISAYSAEALTIAQDSTGRIWSSFTRGKRVYVTASTGSGDAGTVGFGTPFIPSLSNLGTSASTAATTLTADDISTVVSANGFTMVLWSNQVTDTTYSARHSDGAADSAWTGQTVFGGTLDSDDHLNAKVIPGDSQGRVFLAFKTSLNDASPSNPGDALLRVGVYSDVTGRWTTTPLSTVAQSGTRPILVLDPTTDTLSAYYTGPTKAGSIAFQGTIYRKDSSLSSVSFDSGVGTPVLRDASSATMNNATTTKQPVGGGSGSVVLAATEGPLQYWHLDTAAASPPSAPVAGFTASPTSGTAPLGVQFTDASTGAPTSWSWSFGDGTAVSTAQSPSHTFTTAGTFTVTLTATNADGSSSWSTKISVSSTLPSAPVAGFTASPTSGTVPLGVQFTDASTGAPTSWSWNFGDGTAVSTAQSPSHTFATAGTFTVTLTAKNAGGSSSSSATISVSTAGTQTVLERVNAGGVALPGGWLADTKAAPSAMSNAAMAKSTTSSTNAVIDLSDPSVPAGTPVALFQNGRFDTSGGSDMIWTMPVPAAGTYTVRLYFAETYWGSAGKRVFNVDINGVRVLNNFDIFAAAGAKDKAVVKSFPVTTSGPITVDFGRTAADNPLVSGIEVLSS